MRLEMIIVPAIIAIIGVALLIGGIQRDNKIILLLGAAFTIFGIGQFLLENIYNTGALDIVIIIAFCLVFICIIGILWITPIIRWFDDRRQAKKRARLSKTFDYVVNTMMDVYHTPREYGSKVFVLNRKIGIIYLPPSTEKPWVVDYEEYIDKEWYKLYQIEATSIIFPQHYCLLIKDWGGKWD